MIYFNADIRSAHARSDDAITSGSVGIPVALTLDSAFGGLAKTLCFKTATTSADIVLANDATESTVPQDVIANAGEWLQIGIYAADGDGNIVIPTVWANAGKIALGTVPSGVDPSEPTPSWVAQVQNIAEDALEVANSVREDADSGEFDGPKGDKGDKGDTGATGPQGPKGDPGEVTQAEFDELSEDVDDLKSAIAAKSGLSDEAKQALLACFENVAWINDQGQSYVNALEAALYSLVSISAVYTQSGTVYDTDTLDTLKTDLVVTAIYENGTAKTITAYTLSGVLTEGTSTITVSYSGKTTTFDVVVTKRDHIATYPYVLSPASSNDGMWDQTTQTGYVRSHSATGWPALLLKNLLYTYAEVTQKTLRIRMNLTVEGMTEGSGSGVIIAAGLYTTASPSLNNTSQRKADYSIMTIATNGTIPIDETWTISFTGTNLNTYYLGLSIFNNTASGCMAYISDLTVEVV